MTSLMGHVNDLQRSWKGHDKLPQHSDLQEVYNTISNYNWSTLINKKKRPIN